MTVAKRRYTRAAAARVVPTDSATENQTAGVSQETPARVKRCGKSAPREAQATRHGKPHRVQGQIGNPGAARSRFRESGTGSRLPRQMILSIRKGEDRIRLTALPKPTSKPGQNDECRMKKQFPGHGLVSSFCILTSSFSSRPSSCPVANIFSATRPPAHSNFPGDPRCGGQWRRDCRC